MQVWQIRQDITNGVDVQLISKHTLEFFNIDLCGHFKREEDFLFSKLPVGDLLREQAEKEHSQLYQLIDNLSQNRSDIQLLQQFAGLLEKHIRIEERILFNHLQDIMGDKELERLIHEMEA